MASSAPPARETSCWTLSSASARSFAQRSWSATPRSYSAIERSRGSPPVSSSATVCCSAARASSNERRSIGVSGASVTVLLVLARPIDEAPHPGREHDDTEPEPDCRGDEGNQQHDEHVSHVG